MSDGTKIEWTDATWNIITGCSVVSAGCKNCYAMKLAGTRLQHHPSRAGLTVDTSNGPVWNGQVRFNEQWLDQPLEWKRPRMIFVCAHGDLFHESVPDEWIDKIFIIMAMAPHHKFQVLTKRPERMKEYLSSSKGNVNRLFAWPLDNVWLGVSVENQEAADERIPLLLETPAAVRWISAEPLLGPVSFRWASWHDYNKMGGHHHLDGMKGIDWVVAGGESGLNARPIHPEWAQNLRDQCNEAGVAFLFKQWGEWKPISQDGDDWHDGLYKPNRLAKEYEDQDVLNDIYGRRCMVRNGIVHFNGTVHDVIDLGAFQAGTRAMHSFKVGKKAAGRNLDGRTWDEYPTSTAS